MELLATRAFDELDGISSSMSTKMNRILAQGMAEGRSAKYIGKRLAAEVKGISKSRGLMIARTEIINAHAEGQLDAFSNLGIDELGVEAEWSTAGDERVCPQCDAMNGQTFTVEEARGLIPAHPNCRCSWIPAETKKKKKKGGE